MLSLSQIYSHYSNILISDMTLDHLYMSIATTNCEFMYKANWLKQWNDSSDVRRANHFPDIRPMGDKPLLSFLHQASL